MPEFATQMEKVFASLSLRDNVKVAAKGDLQMTTVEKFKMTGLFAYRATYPFSNSSHFAPVWREKRENAISFTYISALEYYSFNRVAALLSHGDTLKVNRCNNNDKKRRDLRIKSRLILWRRRADSNRWCSCCRAVPYHLATSPHTCICLALCDR